jgi:hypothetical protein
MGRKLGAFLLDVSIAEPAAWIRRFSRAQEVDALDDRRRRARLGHCKDRGDFDEFACPSRAWRRPKGRRSDRFGPPGEPFVTGRTGATEAALVASRQRPERQIAARPASVSDTCRM